MDHFPTNIEISSLRMLVSCVEHGQDLPNSERKISLKRSLFYFTTASPYSFLIGVPLGYEKGVRMTVILIMWQRSEESITRNTLILGGGGYINFPMLFSY